ncbi:acyl-(acyl-carrier-protein)--UDP-N-acetylglucosamine O-acyltransferase [Candidatus Magnetomoraceae bacterium gMMP-15]
MIHPTAIIDPGAEIDENVEIGPYSIIADKVRIGSGTIIESHVNINTYTTIDSDCHIFQYASIGTVPQDLKFKGGKTYVTIGKGTVIREFVSINRGTESGGGVTRIGEKNYLMVYTHIAHDCCTGKEVVLANNTTFAGHITVGDYATIGGLVAIHQFVNIGDYAFVGGKSAVTKDIPPYVIASGDRAKLHGLNKVGLKRRGFSSEVMNALKQTYRIIFRIGLTLNEAIERVLAEVDHVPEVLNFIDFIKKSERGITR